MATGENGKGRGWEEGWGGGGGEGGVVVDGRYRSRHVTTERRLGGAVALKCLRGIPSWDSSGHRIADHTKVRTAETRLHSEWMRTLCGQLDQH